MSPAVSGRRTIAPGTRVQPLRSPSNPFCTRFVAPGKLPWLAADSLDLDSLERRFWEQARRGAIVGPHGSGKSSLLEHFVPRLGSVVYRYRVGGQAPPSMYGSQQFAFSQPLAQSAGQAEIIWLGLRRASGEMNLRRSMWQPGRILVLDGFEQLGRFKRVRVQLETRMRKMGLLVTCHQRVMIKTLIATRMSLDAAIQLVGRLLDAADVEAGLKTRLLDRGRIASRLQLSGGNVRELLMQLYDDYELHQPDFRSIHNPDLNVPT